MVPITGSVVFSRRCAVSMLFDMCLHSHSCKTTALNLLGFHVYNPSPRTAGLQYTIPSLQGVHREIIPDLQNSNIREIWKLIQRLVGGTSSQEVRVNQDWQALLSRFSPSQFPISYLIFILISQMSLLAQCEFTVIKQVNIVQDAASENGFRPDTRPSSGSNKEKAIR